MENLLEKNQITFTPEKCKQKALARLDVVHQWLEFRKQSQNKLQADYDFVQVNFPYQILSIYQLLIPK